MFKDCNSFLENIPEAFACNLFSVQTSLVVESVKALLLESVCKCRTKYEIKGCVSDY